MPTKIKIKNSNSAGKIPTPADLDVAELAVNLVDKKVYTKDAAGTIVELGSKDDIEVYDWSARVEADVGAAYTAWNGGAGTPDYVGKVVFVRWSDAKTYALTDPANPGTAASYAVVA